MEQFVFVWYIIQTTHTSPARANNIIPIENVCRVINHLLPACALLLLMMSLTMCQKLIKTEWDIYRRLAEVYRSTEPSLGDEMILFIG
uniref:Uncharacterized protein n=1 Tax=Pyxicephalus adspersus TaxID=30357 RepID=A0AAV3A014_PYXAD|nr:TPA: hypothetical protein GDO54_003036 [Pyxicephalus adspersus]